MSRNLPVSVDSLVGDFFKAVKRMRSYYPFVICVEGSDGVGKSTLIRTLEERMDSYGPWPGSKWQKNSVVVKYPSPALYNTLVNNSLLTSFERTLLYIADGVVPADEMDEIFLRYSVVILDRHPLFSVPVYNFPKLSYNYMGMAAYAMSRAATSMIVPNLTIVLQNNNFEQDYTYAANVLPQEEIAARYSELVGDSNLHEYLVTKWPELEDVDSISELVGVGLAQSLKLEYDGYDYNVGRVIQMMIDTRENF